MKLTEIFQLLTLILVILLVLRLSISKIGNNELVTYCVLITVLLISYIVVNKDNFENLFNKLINKPKDAYSNFPDIGPETNIEFGNEGQIVNNNAGSVINTGQDKCKYNLCCAEKSDNAPEPVVNDWYNNDAAPLEYSNTETMMGCSANPKYTDINDPAPLNNPPIGKWGGINVLENRPKLLELIPGLIEKNRDPECGWRRPPCNVPLDIELANKVNENDLKYGVSREELPSVNGLQSGPRALSTLAYNQSSPECCPATYSNSVGCICEPLNQSKYINSRGRISK